MLSWSLIETEKSKSLVVVIDGETTTIAGVHPLFDVIVRLLDDSNVDKTEALIRRFMDPAVDPAMFLAGRKLGLGVLELIAIEESLR